MGMIKLCAVLLISSLGLVHPLPAADPMTNVQCTLTYDIIHQDKCHHEEVCHEECGNLVTKHCKSVHTSVHHSSSIVGHDSHVIGQEHNHSHHGKRAARAA